MYRLKQGLPRCLSGKGLLAKAGTTGDVGLILESERSPGGGNGNPLPYSCLENPMDRGAWSATVHGVTKSQTRLSLSLSEDFKHHHIPPWHSDMKWETENVLRC